MYVVESKGGAIGCMVGALVLLGNWPAILAQLERRGRLPQHTYLDYSFTNFFTACFLAFTIGQIGDSPGPAMPNFLTQLHLSRDNWPCILIAMAGGVFLSLGNLSMQYALAFVGLSVTEVTTSSIAVVLGTTLNYFLDDRINRAEILFPGVGCFLVAVCLGSAVHSSTAADDAAKLKELSGACLDSTKYDIENGSHGDERERLGSARHLIELENNRAIKVLGKSIWVGLGITLFGGMCYALFSPAFNLATNDQWHAMRHGVAHLVVYTAFFYFSLSFFVVALLLNIWFLYRPLLNLPKSSIKAYIRDWNGRNWALLAGVVCGLGNGLQFMGGQAAGYAAADCVQALPLVSTFWGIVVLGEYRRSSKRTYVLLVSMLIMFIVAVAVLIASSGHRKASS
ncbi:Ureide permease 2 [Striga hermonthica]|uniref:Ureide permease 2 n=1 Tax=Striga hermonthica TaxID=68872 RepID=A0A9N7RGT1_STRHE|nr:Ureide permease 2 [Striga hermonthica]